MTGPRMDFIVPGWRAPRHVRALTTTRRGGVSSAPYGSLNLADHVGDEMSSVKTNRRLLQSNLGCPALSGWLQQQHGAIVIDRDRDTHSTFGDGSLTRRAGTICAVLTADCAPLFLTDHGGRFVAVLHVGWRGLVAGIVESGLAAVATSPKQVLAWIGPAISGSAYEVGSEVRERLLEVFPEHRTKISPSGARWHADLPGMVEQRLRSAGVVEVGSSGCCTFSEPDKWFSHRRRAPCGRMASMIWIEASK